MTWRAPIANDQNGVLVNYSITYFGIEIDTDTRIIYIPNPVGDQSFTLTNLQEYTTYSINVSSYTKVGKGPDATDAIVRERTNQDSEFK